jgi:hypothetical protein
MTAFRDRPGARKFMAAFGLVCTLSVLLGAHALVTLRSAAKDTGGVSAIPAWLVLGDVRAARNTARRQDPDLLLCTRQAGNAAHSATRLQAHAEYAAGETSESATHISQLAMESSPAAEETADGCKQLSVLANDLDRIIRQFRLSDKSQPGGNPRGGPATAAQRAFQAA